MYYWPLLELMCYMLVIDIRKRRMQATFDGESRARLASMNEAETGDSLLVYYLEFAVAVICLIPLGTDNGAWLSYFYQLALPSMIVVGLTALSKLHRPIVKGLTIVMIILMSCSIGPSLPISCPVMAQSDFSSWTQAYSFLQRYDGKSMFLSPIFADYIEKNGVEIIDNGNVEYYDTLALRNKGLLPKVMGLLMPQSSEQFDRYHTWAESISRNVREQKYSLIAVTKDNHPLTRQKDLEEKYVKIKEMSLRTGNQVAATEFWIPSANH